MSIKGVKLKSESFFSISPGVLELWRKNLRGGGFRPPPPVQIGLSKAKSIFCHEIQKVRRSFPMFNVYSCNLGSAALDLAEPINRLPEGQVMREILKGMKHLPSTRSDQSVLNNPHNRKPQDYAKLQGLNKGLWNTEVQRGNISAILFPKICIT